VVFRPPFGGLLGPKTAEREGEWKREKPMFYLMKVMFLR